MIVENSKKKRSWEIK